MTGGNIFLKFVENLAIFMICHQNPFSSHASAQRLVFNLIYPLRSNITIYNLWINMKQCP